MADDSGYATLRMCLRPPRVAVVFDAGERWHFWARFALYACTKFWGGEGFILIPHNNGTVHPALLAAARAYDPDYVVTLQRTVRTIEQAMPGALSLLDSDGKRSEGTARDQLIEQAGDMPIPWEADEQARKRVAEVCSSHRRRHVSDETGWDEHVTWIAANGDSPHLSKAADIPGNPTDVCLSAPPEWAGTLGVAVAARCGAVEEPQLGAEPGLDESVFRRLVSWLMDPDGGLGTLPPDIVWHPAAASSVDPGSLPTAFERTKHGLTLIGRGFRSRRRIMLSVGDAAEDFALAYVYQRLYGGGIWLPTVWLTANDTGERGMDFAVRTAISGHVLKGDNITVTTTSATDSTLDSIVAGLRQPIFWTSGDEESIARQYEERLTRGTVDWPGEGVQFLAVADQFNHDYAIPITRSEAGDIEMVVPCPPPAINHPTLAASTALRWQVDIELTEAIMPYGRGLDGHALLAEGEDSYLTWIRSGRDGIVYESERYNFIAAGTPPVSRLARPRFRVPSLTTWADLMARRGGKRVEFSGAGRRVEVMRHLWGDRTALAAHFAGPMLPVLRTFRPAGKKSDFKFKKTDGVVLPTGAGDNLWEGYLTFAGILDHGKAEAEEVVAFRRQVDDMLARGVLRRGLILGCAQCGKPAFTMIDNLAQVNRCSRCSALNNLSQPRWREPDTEPQWYYDLHPTVREHLSQDGDIPLLLSHYLRTKARSYIDVAELELVTSDANPLAEADLIALSDGQLITAEAKRPGSLGKSKLAHTAAKRALLAEQLHADQILLATADSQWQEASINALCQQVRTRPWAIPAPRVRLVCGLGTDEITDLCVDVETGQTSLWQ
ncbi:hypothetical protein [Nonomuraea sp. NPDC049646]|uniref:hypothetical protein n=1 Tax=unclassified Nonomuraea TaxID=2593643 RepID=UPI003798AFD4